MRFFSEPQKQPEDGGDDNVGQNPTGRPRRSSARTRRKKDRRLFGGTQWSKDDQTKENGS